MSKPEFVLLSEQEYETLITRFIESRTRQGREYTEYELEAVVRWAERAIVAKSCLELVLQGIVELDLAAGEEVVFQPTPKKATRA